MHHGKVYADKVIEVTEDGYETDDDNMFQLEKRALRPAVLSLSHEPPMSDEESGASSWKAETSSWFLSPLLMALSVVKDPGTLSLEAKLSSLSISSEKQEDEESYLVTIKDMIAMMIQGLDRVLESHARATVGPGTENGWKDVVALTFYYCESLSSLQSQLGPALETLLSAIAKGSEPGGNVAVTLVPVQAIADGGLLALSLHAVGKMPTVPGLLQ